MLVGIILCGLLSVTFDQGSERSFVLELCNGHNSEWLEILYLHNGEVEQYHSQVILTVLFILTVEAASYTTCMYDCYTHDKSMTKILSMETVKKRHRKSAISLVCELYCYIIEASHSRRASRPIAPHCQVYCATSHPVS